MQIKIIFFSSALDLIEASLRRKAIRGPAEQISAILQSSQRTGKFYLLYQLGQARLCCSNKQHETLRNLKQLNVFLTAVHHGSEKELCSQSSPRDRAYWFYRRRGRELVKSWTDGLFKLFLDVAVFTSHGY